MIDGAGLARRRLLAGGGAVLAWTLSASGIPAWAAEGPLTNLSPDEALQRLIDGNQRFMDDQDKDIVIDRARRLELAEGQAPFAILVGCSDSRVSPELVFGRGLGELFIVRNAGNTVDTAALGSIEYAVAELKVPLIVVLGHQRCGAVAAALELVERNATFPGVIGQMVEPILPAVLRARSVAHGGPEELLENCVHENVRSVVKRLRSSQAVLIEPLEAGRLKIVGAYYALGTGKVEFLTDT